MTYLFNYSASKLISHQYDDSMKQWYYSSKMVSLNNSFTKGFHNVRMNISGNLFISCTKKAKTGSQTISVDMRRGQRDLNTTKWSYWGTSPWLAHWLGSPGRQEWLAKVHLIYLYTTLVRTFYSRLKHKAFFIRTVKVTVFCTVWKWVQCIPMVLFTHNA